MPLIYANRLNGAIAGRDLAVGERLEDLVDVYDGVDPLIPIRTERRTRVVAERIPALARIIVRGDGRLIPG